MGKVGIFCLLVHFVIIIFSLDKKFLVNWFKAGIGTDKNLMLYFFIFIILYISFWHYKLFNYWNHSKTQPSPLTYCMYVDLRLLFIFLLLTRHLNFILLLLNLDRFSTTPSSHSLFCMLLFLILYVYSSSFYFGSF